MIFYKDVCLDKIKVSVVTNSCFALVLVQATDERNWTASNRSHRKKESRLVFSSDH